MAILNMNETTIHNYIKHVFLGTYPEDGIPGTKLSKNRYYDGRRGYADGYYDGPYNDRYGYNDGYGFGGKRFP